MPMRLIPRNALAMMLALAALQDATTVPASFPTAVEAADADRAGEYVDIDAARRVDRDVVYNEGFESAHPDLHFRRLGSEARDGGRFEQARFCFRKAARYGDKLAQGAYAEMLWNGEGSAADRALAYAWMDLAAERGAPLLVTHRERYWHRLDTAARARAVREGEAVHAEYADRVAKPRLERELRIARNRVTGSRVGWLGPMTLCLEAAERGCGKQVSGDRYYADRYWKPDEYWRWQDDVLRTPDRDRRVDVGAPKPVPAGDGD